MHEMVYTTARLYLSHTELEYKGCCYIYRQLKCDLVGHDQSRSAYNIMM